MSGLYEPFRLTLNAILGKDASERYFPTTIAAGTCTGVVGGMISWQLLPCLVNFNAWAAFVGNPLFLVKARMQAYSPSLPVGTQRHYKSGLDALRSIYSTDGFRGLFRGARAAMFRTSLGTSVQMPTYFFAKRKVVERGVLREDSPVTVVLSSAAAGAMVVSIDTAYGLWGLILYSVLVYVSSGHYSHKTVRMARRR